MGLLGDIVYGTEDSDLKDELNSGNQLMLDFNSLHNALVNNYRTHGESSKTFNSYLMALIACQYHYTYAKESLENISKIPMPNTANATRAISFPREPKDGRFLG